MKKNIIIVSILAFLLTVPAFAAGAKVTIDGMVCAFCAQGIKKKFNENPAVEKVEVDLEKKLVELTYKKNMTLTDLVITDTIKSAGYAVRKVEQVK